MDGNRNWNEILFSVDALDRRLRAIEEYRRNAPDMSEEALREMRGELDMIRAALGVPGAGPWQAGMAARQENIPNAGWDHRMPSAAYQGCAYQGGAWPGATRMQGLLSPMELPVYRRSLPLQTHSERIGTSGIWASICWACWPRCWSCWRRAF